MLLAIDTETTGKDLHHGARPFFVTVCDGEGNQKYWEWWVDPKTRRPLVKEEHLDEIEDMIRSHSPLVLQHAKFDVTALGTLRPRIRDEWRWDDTFDTLQAGHLLASSQKHDLGSMAVHYLAKDISKFETRLRDACVEARRVARARFKAWRLAKEGVPGMPSVKQSADGDDKPWKNDMWLPRAVARATECPVPDPDCDHSWPADTAPPGERWKCRRCGGHRWWEVLADYSNADSEVTAGLGVIMPLRIEAEGLTAVWGAHRKVGRVAHRMEYRGVTGNLDRLGALEEEYKVKSAEAAAECVAVARMYDYDLSLPKSGNNNSLVWFCFGKPREVAEGELKDTPLFPNRERYLDLPILGRTDNGNPSLDKDVLEMYEATLEPSKPQFRFVTALARKRKLDTQLTYMAAYRRFMLPWVPASDWGHPDLPRPDARTGAGYYVLHPSLNPTGTATLRWSSSNPNEQNISKKEITCRACRGEGCPECKHTGKVLRSLRLCFGPAPGREWWSLDAKNIELRIPAYESGEQELIELFERPDDPPFYGSNHMLIFATLWPELWRGAVQKVGEEKAAAFCKKEYGSSQYQWTKNGDFAVQYGAVDRDDGEGTADRAYHQKGAQAKIKARFVKQEALNQKYIRLANQYGYVETMPDRSVDPTRGYPVMCSRTEYGKIRPTVPLNYHVQSTAMWWMGQAMVRVQEFFDRLNRGERWRGRFWPGGYHLALQVHDELVPDMPSGKPWVGKRVVGTDGARLIEQAWQYNLPVAREVKRLMEVGGDNIGVPTPVSMEWHETSWAEGVSV